MAQVAYGNKIKSASEALKSIKSGDSLYIHSNASAPHTLIEALIARAPELKDVKIYQIITLGPAPYADAKYKSSFYLHSLFVGPNVRSAVNCGDADYTPVFFSDLPNLFANKILPVDVCLLQTSKPDKDGYMSYGLSMDCTLGAKKHARLVIAEVNEQMPATFGAAKIHINEVDSMVESNRPLPELPIEEPGEAEITIGKNIASLVDDGATIQMGIGTIPNAALKALSGKKDLGIHSEMFSDGILDLVKAGVVNNSKKTVLPGKIAVSFVMGSRRLYDFVNGNTNIEFHPNDFINDPYIIAQNYRMTSINAALEIDLTGQVCADSLGTYLYSGCGGQVDFIRGASRAKEGKAIIALPSTAKKGSVSRISSILKPGAGVVTSRADVHYVITEYGIAYLHGKNLKQRVKALIEIAHPKFRAELEKDAFEQFVWYRNN